MNFQVNMQGECLALFLFSIYLNDLENELGNDGFDTGMLKLYLLLYAVCIVIFSKTSEVLQRGLDNLFGYCNSCKRTFNTDKTEIMIFRKKRHLT